jgi:hypothetical protein
MTPFSCVSRPSGRPEGWPFSIVISRSPDRRRMTVMAGKRRLRSYPASVASARKRSFIDPDETADDLVWNFRSAYRKIDLRRRQKSAQGRICIKTIG